MDGMESSVHANYSGIYPWNYTIPDLKIFMNGTGLPPIHDLLGITTTTTELVTANRPVFPLNLTFWASITSSWRQNNSNPANTYVDSYLDEVEDVTEDSNSYPTEDYRTDQQKLLGRERLQGTYNYRNDLRSQEGIAQMVVPASINSEIESYSSSAKHNDFINSDSIGLLVFENGSSYEFFPNTSFNGSIGEVGPGMSTPGIIIVSFILGIMILITVLGNVFVIAAILIERNLQQVANFLIVSLAVADLMVACLVMPLGAVYEISREWNLGPELCDMWTSSDVLCCTASILHLVAIALDRFWAVTRVDYIQTRRNSKRIGMMILLIWMTAVIVAMAPFFGWKGPEDLYRVNEQKKCLVSQDMSYQIFATMSTFYVPLTAILILYWRIFQTAKKRLHKRPGKTNQKKKKSIKKKDKKSKVKSSRSNGIVQATTTFTDEPSENKPMTPEYSSMQEPIGGNEQATPTAISLRSSGVSCITGNLVELRQQQHYLIPPTTNKVHIHSQGRECVISPASIQGGGRETLNNKIEYGNCSYSNPQPNTVVSLVDKYGGGYVQSDVDVQLKPLLHSRDSIVPPYEFREDTYILKQNFYGEGEIGAAEPVVRTSSISIGPSQSNVEPREIYPIYTHESMNTSSHSLYKNESTNTDPIYDYQLPSNLDTMSLQTNQSQPLNYGDVTTQTYIIEPSVRDVMCSSIDGTRHSTGSLTNQNYAPCLPEQDVLHSITPGFSETNLPSNLYEEKNSKSSPDETAEDEIGLQPIKQRRMSRLKALSSHLKKNECSSVTSLASSTVKSKASSSSHHQTVHVKKSKKETLEAKREKKAAKTLAIITGAFVVCWLPFFVMALCMSICPHCWASDILFSFFLWLGYFNSTLNPIIYTIFSPEFRGAFKKMLCGRKSNRYRPGKYR